MIESQIIDQKEKLIRKPLPSKICNIDRLIFALKSRNLDGIVVTNPLNIFYLTSFNGVAHKSDEPRPYAFVFSRHAPEHPILVVADYYLSSFLQQPSWVKDIRPFRAVMMPLDLAPKKKDIDRFIVSRGKEIAWVEEACKNYCFSMKEALENALTNLQLKSKRIGFDDMGAGFRFGFENIQICDAYDAIMYARAVKTSDEISLLRRATSLNEKAIQRTIKSWKQGGTWRDLDSSYSHHVTELGGFVRDPGGMIWGHPSGTDHALMLNAGLDNKIIDQGTHVMFDCHGTLDLYCWDGGKTWVVEDELKSTLKKGSIAIEAVASEVIRSMRPGFCISELQALARNTFSKAGVSDVESAIIFFHGLGLSHMDIETFKADGTSNFDWVLEENMVVPLHLLYPGGEKERLWLEEVVLIGPDGGEPLFSWGFSPIIL